MLDEGIDDVWSGAAGALVLVAAAKDLKRRAPFYASDWTDAFRPENMQMLGLTMWVSGM